MTIWKWRLSNAEIQHVEMPEGAKLLTVQEQGGYACLWAIVQPELPKVRRRIWVVGTGHEHASFPANHIATAQNGPLVWHFFDLGECPA